MEIYEFTYPDDDYCTTIIDFTEKEFIAGFNTGIVWILSLDKLCIIKEYFQHKYYIETLA